MKNYQIPRLRFKRFTKEWEEKKLDEVLKISKSKYNPLKEKKEYPCIELESLSQETGKVLKIFNSFEQKSIKNKFLKGEILFGKLRPYLKKYWYSNFKGVCSSEIWVFNSNKNNKFIYYFIQGDKFITLSNTTSGTKMPRADWNLMKNEIFLFPHSLQEQEKIADFLSSVDKKISITEEKLELFNEYKKGIMQKIFSQKLRFKTENGNNYPEWEEKKLGEIGIFYRGHSYNSNNVVNYGLLVLRSNNIQNNIINYNDLQFVNKDCKEEIVLKDKDIVICMANGSKRLVGKTGEYKENLKYSKITVGAFCSIFRTNNKIAKFLFQTKKYYDEIALMLEGTNINNLKNSALEEISFDIPHSFEEQQKIADFLSAIDTKIEKISDELENLKEFKKGLLQQMFV